MPNPLPPAPFLSLISVDLTTPRRWEMEMTTTLEALAAARVERFAMLLREMMPNIRRLAPNISEEELIEIASKLAEHRLADDDRGLHREQP